MMVDMSKVSWMAKGQIRQEAEDLVNQWRNFSGQDVKPPIPVEAIAEKYLGFSVEFDNLEVILGIPDVLGATWANEKRMLINSSLLDGVEGRIAFTCGHEIGHWMLHRKYLAHPLMGFESLGDDEEPTVVCRLSASKLRGEWQADYFSSCLLMPGAEVESAYQRVFGSEPVTIYNEKSCFGRNNPIVLDPALDTVKEIAKKVIHEGEFTNVSMEAMCYRLHDLGLLINLTGKPLVTRPRLKGPFQSCNKI